MQRFLFLFGLLFIVNVAHGQSFHGYPCTVDCSGHEAGYEWAEKNDIDDEADCSGKSNSFIEGCQAYVEDNQDIDDEAKADEAQEADEDDEDEDDEEADF